MSVASFSNDVMFEELCRNLAPAILPASVHLQDSATVLNVAERNTIKQLGYT